MPCVNCDLDLGNMSLIVWYIIKIQLGSDNLWPQHDFGYVCTVTLTSMIRHWVKVMTHPWVMDNNCVKYYLDPTWQRGVMARTRILGMCALWPWPRRYDLGSRSWHILGSWTIHVCEILSRSNLAVRSYDPDFEWVLWPWPWRYDLGSRSWHTLRSWTTIVCNIIQIGQVVMKLRPGHDVNRRTDRRIGWLLYTTASMYNNMRCQPSSSVRVNTRTVEKTSLFSLSI